MNSVGEQCRGRCSKSDKGYEAAGCGPLEDNNPCTSNRLVSRSLNPSTHALVEELLIISECHRVVVGDLVANVLSAKNEIR